jgi:hypothetical protein
MKKLQIYIDVQDSLTCGECCPFLKDSECTLFNVDLEETELPDGFKWNDCKPTLQRFYKCLYFN